MVKKYQVYVDGIAQVTLSGSSKAQVIGWAERLLALGYIIPRVYDGAVTVKRV